MSDTMLVCLLWVLLAAVPAVGAFCYAAGRETMKEMEAAYRLHIDNLNRMLDDCQRALGRPGRRDPDSPA